MPKETDKFAIIWNYIKMLEAYKSVYSIIKFADTHNYISNKSSKTTWGY